MLLLIDGTNVTMRCAFGGDVPVERAVPIAVGMIRRAISATQPTHCIIALDAPGESWRRRRYPAYKANRTRETHSYSLAAEAAFAREGWFCAAAPGFEADDVIATLAHRAMPRPVVILSGDSDLLALASPRVRVVKPGNASDGFVEVRDADTMAKYGIKAPHQLTDYKALVGERGDNVPGVPGIGPKRASRLLTDHGTLDAILEAGAVEHTSRDEMTVYAHRETALLARELVTLRTDAPIAPIPGNRCALQAVRT